MLICDYNCANIQWKLSPRVFGLSMSSLRHYDITCWIPAFLFWVLPCELKVISSFLAFIPQLNIITKNQQHLQKGPKFGDTSCEWEMIFCTSYSTALYFSTEMRVQKYRNDGQICKLYFSLTGSHENAANHFADYNVSDGGGTVFCFETNDDKTRTVLDYWTNIPFIERQLYTVCVYSLTPFLQLPNTP